MSVSQAFEILPVREVLLPQVATAEVVVVAFIGYLSRSAINTLADSLRTAGYILAQE